MHSVTGKLNKAARQFQNQAGMTFFVSIGEQNYDHKTKQKVWTNYEAALFAKDGQIQYYNDVLVENAIITVCGTGLIVQVDEGGQYPPKLVFADAKLEFAHTHGAQQAPQQNYQQPQQAPQQRPQQQPAPQQRPQHQPAQQTGQPPQDDFDDDIPF
jgi:single-strand DNA-binding protein